MSQTTTRRGGALLTLRKILCPVDFSEVSRAAFRQSVALAARTHGVVHVIHAVDVPFLPIADGTMVVGERLAGEAKARNQVAIQAWLTQQRVKDVPVECHIVTGSPAHAIVAEARALQCDAIVMGTHGRTGISQVLLGSVAEKVVRTATVPTLVVPDVRTEDGREPRSIRSILCPVDFSEVSELALSEAARLSRAIGAALHVVHCWDMEGRFDGQPDEGRRRERDFSDDLAEVTRRCVPEAPEPKRHLRNGVPYVEIVDLALQLDVELIVMGTNGRTGLDHFLIGSVAERVVRTSPIPVLTLRAPRPLPN